MNDITNCGDPNEINFAKEKFIGFLEEQIFDLKKAGYEGSRECYERKLSRDTIERLSRPRNCWVFCLADKDTLDKNWKKHGDDNFGLCIGFNIEALLDNNSKMPLILRKVVYDREIMNDDFKLKLKIAQTYIKTTLDHYKSLETNYGGTIPQPLIDIYALDYYREIKDLLLPFFATFKKGSFVWEMEWRFIFTASDTEQYVANHKLELNKPGEIILKWPLCFDLNRAVKAITIGYKSNLTEKYVKSFLKNKCDLSDNEIKMIDIYKREY